MLPREIQQGRDGQEPPRSMRLWVAEHYRHFNSAVIKRAVDAYVEHLDKGGLMFLSMAGAMSTAELGRSLAPMIRAEKISAICCTGANLEEDLFNLVAHQHYEIFERYHDLTPEEERRLYKRHINRVTDTGIPEQAAMTPIEDAVVARWQEAKDAHTPIFPHEALYAILNSGELASEYEGDPKDSWLLAAAECDLPIFVPGWEDSTLGNVFAAECIKGTFDPTTIKGGIDYMMALADWYTDTSQDHPLGYFQIGGGIAGDFAICVVPLLEQDCGVKGTRKWEYFCQITDADESMGGYSGALPNEKITWGKLEVDTPAFAIKGDATIIAPIMFACVMGE